MDLGSSSSLLPAVTVVPSRSPVSYCDLNVLIDALAGKIQPLVRAWRYLVHPNVFCVSNQPFSRSRAIALLCPPSLELVVAMAAYAIHCQIGKL